MTALSFAALASACVIALTLGHPVTDWNPKRIAHWVSTGCYIFFLFASLSLFFLLNLKKNKGFLIAFFCVLAILLIFGLWLIFLGKSAMNELVPYLLLQILLFVLNYTNAIRITE